MPHGIGHLGATCAGCIWLREIEYAHGSSVYGCALVATMPHDGPADLRREPWHRACALYERQNGQVTAPFFPHREPK